MPDYGMTPYGFVAKDMQTIYNEIFDTIDQNLGLQVNREYDSIIGSLVQVIASREAQTWAMLQELYYQSFPISASGMSLNFAVSLAGITPFRGIPSRVFCKCGASGQVTIAKGTTITSNQNSEDNWITPYEQKITPSKTIEVAIEITVAFGYTYKIDINGNEYSFLNMDINNTATDIFNALNSLINDDNFEITLSGNIMRIKADVPFSINTGLENTNFKIVEVYSLLRFDREDVTNVKTVKLNTLTRVVSENSNLESVTNELPMQKGIVAETDEELRKRWSATAMNPNSMAMKDAIKYNILNKVDLVTYCNVYENKKDVSDQLGLLPHSFLVVVEGGDDEEIAKMIYNNLCAGIDMNGNTTVTVTDQNGNNQAITFMRPHQRNIYCSITIIRDNNYNAGDWTDTMVKRINDAVKGYFSKLACGQTATAKRIEQAIMGVSTDINDVNVYISTESVRDAQENKTKIINGRIDTHYVLNKEVHMYVVDERNS